MRTPPPLDEGLDEGGRNRGATAPSGERWNSGAGGAPMLNAIGDVLNWVAAGVIFPLMFLPLATLDPRRGPAGALVFVLIVLSVAVVAVAFTAAAPRLDIADVERKAVIFGGAVAALGAFIALAGGPQPATRRLASAFERIARRAGRIVMWLVLGMALVQFAVVILRYVFGLNFIFMQEGITYMHGAVFLLAAGYALLTNDHVRVDIFYRGASERKKALIDLAGTYLFLFPVALAALWTGSDYVAQSWAVREGSTEQSGIQGVFILKSLIPMFATLIAMAGFTMAARAAETMRGAR